MQIYIVRHGETNANESGRLQGWSDDPLNENGRRLAVITGCALKGIHFDCCISSPLSRAKETAEILLRESGNDLQIYTENRIMEVNMGQWERKKFRPGEREMEEHRIREFFTDPFLFGAFPGGETTLQVCERTQAFLKELLRTDDGRKYLVVTHGFALRAMLNFLYENPKDFWHGHVPYNCTVNVVNGERGVGILVEDDRIYYDISEETDRYRVF